MFFGILIFGERMRDNNYLWTFISAMMVKHEKYRVLLIFDDLSKNVEKTINTHALKGK